MRLARRIAAAGGVAVLALVSVAAGQQSAAAPPGRLELRFGGLSRRAAQVSEVSLDGAMLALGIRTLSAGETDARARQALAQLQGVYIKAFRFDEDGMYSQRDLDNLRRQLAAPGWAHTLSVHSRRDRKDVDVYVMSTDEGVSGMAIIEASPRELRVVNLVGRLDPAELRRLGGHFGIPCVAADKDAGAGAPCERSQP